MGILRQAPADEDARHLADRSSSSPTEAARPQGRQRADRADAGDGDEKGSPPARQPREDLRRSIPRENECQRRRRRQQHAGDEGSRAEARLQLRLALGIHRQVRGRQEREETLREQTAGDGEERRPPREEAARQPPVGDADLARRQGAQAQAEDKRREEARRAEHRAPAPVHRVVLSVVLAEDECGAAQDDADEDRRHRDVQGRHDGGERGREGGEEDHDDQDEPDVVSLPDRPDGVLDGRPLARRPGSPGQEVPHATAVIRAAREGIDHERRQDHRPQPVLNRHATLPGALANRAVRSGPSRGTDGGASTRG